MPRASAEERAASIYRAGKAAKEPPKTLPARAKAIWREIVNSKPADWFDGGSLGLLADHCRTQARLEECWRRLDRFPVGSREARLVMVELKTLRSNYTTSGRLLRLTVTEAIERRSSQIDETAGVAGDDLVGGAAIRPLRAVA